MSRTSEVERFGPFGAPEPSLAHLVRRAWVLCMDVSDTGNRPCEPAEVTRGFCSMDIVLTEADDCDARLCVAGQSGSRLDQPWGMVSRPSME